MTFAVWQAAETCTGQAGPGARALMRWVLDNHPEARSLGIYNCRTVRGGETTSAHGEGRALDVAFPMVDGKGSPAGHALVEELIKVAGRLGIQAIIYDRKIWSARSPKGRKYTGAVPHYDHVHIELTRDAAARLTLATVKAATGQAPKPPAPAKVEPLHATTRPGRSGPQVPALQRALIAAGYGPIPHAVTNHYGPETRAAVARFHKANRQFSTADHDVAIGPKGWAHLQAEANARR